MTLSVALIEPQIPPNTGNIGRLCAATGSSLHIIGPTGFSLSDERLKRAGLDYWNEIDLWMHPDWTQFREAISRDRCLYFSAHGTTPYTDAKYAVNSVLVFGSETKGMPRRLIEKYPERTFRIPMRKEVRNINLATSAGVVLYEAIRQLELKLT